MGRNHYGEFSRREFCRLRHHRAIIESRVCDINHVHHPQAYIRSSQNRTSLCCRAYAKYNCRRSAAFYLNAARFRPRQNPKLHLWSNLPVGAASNGKSDASARTHSGPDQRPGHGPDNQAGGEKGGQDGPKQPQKVTSAALWRPGTRSIQMRASWDHRLELRAAPFMVTILIARVAAAWSWMAVPRQDRTRFRARVCRNIVAVSLRHSSEHEDCDPMNHAMSDEMFCGKRLRCSTSML